MVTEGCGVEALAREEVRDGGAGDGHGVGALGDDDRVIDNDPDLHDEGEQAHDVDGHNINDLIEIMKNVPDGTKKPIAIIALSLLPISELSIDWNFTVENPFIFILRV